MSPRALVLSTRALRIGARAKAPVLLRGGLILLLGLAVWTAFELSRISVETGPMLLTWVVWTDWVLISLLAIGSFSAVLTEEKELMTLGLLRLAGFTPVSLMLGKSIGLLVQTLLLLVVQVPFCMLAITLGGVAVGQVAGVFALLGSYILFVYALALLCSVLRARNLGAAVLTAALLVGYHLVPWLVIGLLHYFADGPPRGLGQSIAAWCMDWFNTSALSGLFAATSGRGSFVLSFTSHITTNLLLALGLFCVAWLAFDPCNRNEVPSAPARGGFSLRVGSRRRALRAWSNPFLWKDYRFTSGGAFGVLLRVAIYGGFFLLVGALAREMSGPGLGGFMMGATCVALVLEAGLQLGRFLADEVKAKTLASLVALPQSLGYVLWSKVAGSLFLCLPALGFFAWGAMLAPEHFGDLLDELIDQPEFWMVIGQVVFGLHLTVYFSVLVSRGALGLAIAALILGNLLFRMLIVAFGSTHVSDATLSELVLLALVPACVALQFGIGRRVRRLAAEE